MTLGGNSLLRRKIFSVFFFLPKEKERQKKGIQFSFVFIQPTRNAKRDGGVCVSCRIMTTILLSPAPAAAAAVDVDNGNGNGNCIGLRHTPSQAQAGRHPRLSSGATATNHHQRFDLYRECPRGAEIRDPEGRNNSSVGQTQMRGMVVVRVVLVGSWLLLSSEGKGDGEEEKKVSA